MHLDNKTKEICFDILKALTVQAYGLLVTYVFYSLKMRLWGTTSSSPQIRLYYIVCGLVYLTGLFFVLRFATSTKHGFLNTFQYKWSYFLLNAVGIAVMIVQYAHFLVSIGTIEFGTLSFGFLHLSVLCSMIMLLVTSVLVCFCEFPASIYPFFKKHGDVSALRKVLSILCCIVALGFSLFSLRDYLCLGTGMLWLSHYSTIMAFTFASVGAGLRERIVQFKQ